MTIHCFSGTGNSAWVAERLTRLLGLESTPHSLVWVMPVYSWGLPPYVASRIEGDNLDGVTCHLVCTCGDDTGHIDRQWRQLIESRGGTVGGIYSVQMPNTYVCLPGFDVDSPKVEAEKLSRAEGRVEQIAGWIRSGNDHTDIMRGALPGLKSGPVRRWFFSRLMKADKFWVDAERCVSCGSCWSLCPAGNITADADGHPVWADHCAFCLRCYHVCPKHAVGYSRYTRSKKQYLHPYFLRLVKISH